ncbi:MAG: hypothetical protein ACYSUK_00020 [Planctomycetota bacterium]|jgi:hypothetical protein
MKTCTKCDIAKPLNQFAKNKKGKDGLRSTCKECHNSYYREYHARPGNMKKQVARVDKNKKTYRWKIGTYKEEKGCCVCGYNTTRYSLHFHHINPSEKLKAINKLTAKSSLDTLTSELNKCVLLCANCHGEVEAGILRIGHPG